MIIERDARFEREWRRYGLKFTCEDCACWDPNRDRCAHGYPTSKHRATRYEDPEAPLLFCKEFEAL